MKLMEVKQWRKLNCSGIVAEKMNVSHVSGARNAILDLPQKNSGCCSCSYMRLISSKKNLLVSKKTNLVLLYNKKLENLLQNKVRDKIRNVVSGPVCSFPPNTTRTCPAQNFQ